MFSTFASKPARIDTENAILTLVPFQFRAADLPFPRAHLAGGKRQAAALLAFHEPRVRRFKLRGALGHPPLQLDVHLFEFARLAEQLDKNTHLGPQNFGNDRYRHVIHRAQFVSAHAIDVGYLDRGNEDDGRLLKPRMLADHGRQLEAVELRHAHVDENDGDIVLEQICQRLPRRRSLDQIFSEVAQDHLVGQKLIRLVVDQKDVDFVSHGSCLAMQPHPQGGE